MLLFSFAFTPRSFQLLAIQICFLFALSLLRSACAQLRVTERVSGERADSHICQMVGENVNGYEL